MIRLYDSLTGELRELAQREPGRVSMYVCGPTVDNLPHLGHGRFSLVWDVARRWMSFRGLDVHYVSNITDIDDKIIARATREGVTTSDVVARYEAEWWAAMTALGVKRPDDTPHATQFVADMVGVIEELLEKDVAYQTSDGVYFDVSRVADYGALAGQPLDSLRAGARVEENTQKRSALDFVLWKNAKPGEPSWPAPFGEGRPGWHTECVVMSLDLLGEGFDLHCGGLDLKFPHHENERAQAVALGRDFAHHWGHNGWVMVGDEKMSKSLGNFTSLSELTATTDPRAYRLLVLRSHYRSPIEVSTATILDAERALERLDAAARRFGLCGLASEDLTRESDFAFSGEGAELVSRAGALIDEDLNTPGALALVFEALSRANTLADRGEMNQARDVALGLHALCGALGLALEGGEATVDAESAVLVASRDEARARRDWKEADRLRDELVQRGWTVEDTVAGTSIRP